jgi:ribosomal protein S18 acetylase RimI-like enzyme
MAHRLDDIVFQLANQELHEKELAELVKKSSWKFLKEFPFVWVRYEGWKNSPPIIAIDSKSNKIVGFYAAMHLKRDPYANMYYLYTVPELKGRGIGSALMAEGIKLAESAGLTRLTWKVIKENDGAIAFYKKLGFLPIAKSEKEYVYDIGFSPFVSLTNLSEEALAHKVYDTDERPISKKRRNKYTTLRFIQNELGKFTPIDIQL